MWANSEDRRHTVESLSSMKSSIKKSQRAGTPVRQAGCRLGEGGRRLKKSTCILSLLIHMSVHNLAKKRKRICYLSKDGASAAKR
jgi:hypothetical protein